MIRAHSERPLVRAGFVVWIAAGVPQMAAWASGRAGFEQRSVVWCAAYASFAIALHLAARTLRRRAWRAAALAGQSAESDRFAAPVLQNFDPSPISPVVAIDEPLQIPIDSIARPSGFEPLTYGSGGRRSPVSVARAL